MNLPSLNLAWLSFYLPYTGTIAPGLCLEIPHVAIISPLLFHCVCHTLMLMFPFLYTLDRDFINNAFIGSFLLLNYLVSYSIPKFVLQKSSRLIAPRSSHLGCKGNRAYISLLKLYIGLYGSSTLQMVAPGNRESIHPLQQGKFPIKYIRNIHMQMGPHKKRFNVFH